MKPVLSIPFEVVYYDGNGHQIYWPADTRSEVLADKLREARRFAMNARLSQAAAAVIQVSKAA